MYHLLKVTEHCFVAIRPFCGFGGISHKKLDLQDLLVKVATIISRYCSLIYILFPSSPLRNAWKHWLEQRKIPHRSHHWSLNRQAIGLSSWKSSKALFFLYANLREFYRCLHEDLVSMLTLNMFFFLSSSTALQLC